MTRELPKGWAWARFDECLTVTNGRAYSKHEERDSGTPVLRIQNLNGGEHWFYSDLKLGPEKYCEQGDLLYAWSATFGPYFYQGPKAIYHYHIWRVDPYPHFLKAFAFYTLRHVTEAIKRSAHGVAMPHITKARMEAWQIPLPPVNEQKRIVKKLEDLQSRSKRARVALESIPPLIDKFRQSVLAAAFRGDLTKEWREKNRDKIEPASELLKRIRFERRRKWEEEQLKKFEAAGKAPKDDRWKEKYKEPEGADTEGLPELPEGWCWATWGDILLPGNESFRRGPFGSSLKKSMFVKAGFKVYEQYCPINDDCSFGRYYITAEKFRELESFAVQPGDYLVSCSGVTLGRITQVPRDAEPGIINQALLRVRINSRIVTHDYFRQFFRSPFFQTQIFENATGSAIPNVKGVSELRRLPVPIPPPREQLEITKKLCSILSALPAVRDKVSFQLAGIAQLEKSILARAFRGELVKQDPNDKPASVLLDRVHDLRELKQRVSSSGSPTSCEAQGADRLRDASVPLEIVVPTRGF